MRASSICIATLLLAALAVEAVADVDLVTVPRREATQLTIYNSEDITMVREHRLLTVKQGINRIQFTWANTLIDPTSLSLAPLKFAGQIDIEQLVFPPRLRELGRWLIKSFIKLPDHAEPGIYALEARFESPRGRFNVHSDFLVEPGRR